MRATQRAGRLVVASKCLGRPPCFLKENLPFSQPACAGFLPKKNDEKKNFSPFNTRSVSSLASRSNRRASDTREDKSLSVGCSPRTRECLPRYPATVRSTQPDPQNRKGGGNKEKPNQKRTRPPNPKINNTMADSGWTTVEKKGPKEAAGKASGARQERSANGGGARGSGAQQQPHQQTKHIIFFS